ncbi:hypothetical protein [Demequina sp.]|uniref:hypothetical protein n=1 Tax=Demequina sp. TaxID=2050685 RepID=UPI0025C26F57|nr:hypothetical protein [Demequina sp.]
MDTTLAAVLITASVSIGGSWLVARQSAANRYQQRIKDLEDRDAKWEDRCNVLWAAREADALIKRAQGDHIDVLEDHIWHHKPPPPPPRPHIV